MVLSPPSLPCCGRLLAAAAAGSGELPPAAARSPPPEGWQGTRRHSWRSCGRSCREWAPRALLLAPLLRALPLCAEPDAGDTQHDAAPEGVARARNGQPAHGLCNVVAASWLQTSPLTAENLLALVDGARLSNNGYRDSSHRCSNRTHTGPCAADACVQAFRQGRSWGSALMDRDPCLRALPALLWLLVCETRTGSTIARAKQGSARSVVYGWPQLQG